MQHTFSFATLGVAAGLLIALPVLAQTKPPTADSVPVSPSPTPPGSPRLVAAVRVDGGWRASKLIGAAVHDDQNRQVGTVDDLILSAQNKVAVAVVSVGGFLGIGSKLVAVPYDRLRHDSGKDAKVVMPGATKDGLNAMPNFVHNGG